MVHPTAKFCGSRVVFYINEFSFYFVAHVNATAVESTLDFLIVRSNYINDRFTI